MLLLLGSFFLFLFLLFFSLSLFILADKKRGDFSSNVSASFIQEKAIKTRDTNAQHLSYDTYRFIRILSRQTIARVKQNVFQTLYFYTPPEEITTATEIRSNPHAYTSN